MFRTAIFSAVLVASTVAAAPVPKDLKKQVSLDGTWEVVEYHANGRKMNSTAAIKWVIDGQNLTIERVNKGAAVAAIVRPGAVTYSLVKPEGGAENALDYTLSYPNGQTPTRSMPGIFELEGDTFKFCWANAVNGERPTECKAAQGTLMYVFKRADVAK